MSNNAWKQYGGISKVDNFTTINASTIIADQFISRSTRPTYQFLNGTFQTSLDLISGRHLMSYDSTYVHANIAVNGNIYNNNKLYFGGNESIEYNDPRIYPTISIGETHAYMYGNAINIGVNTIEPKTAFNITGIDDSITDILTIESSNIYNRNIIAQNVNQRGVVIDTDDISSNIHFYNDDISTNNTNAPSATIQSTSGGIISTSTYSNTNVADGQFSFSASGTSLKTMGGVLTDISGEIHIQTEQGYLLNTSGGLIFLDQSTGNMQLDTSNNFIVN